MKIKNKYYFCGVKQKRKIMKEKKMFKVGEVFQCGRVKLKVEKADNRYRCNGCIFDSRSCSGAMLLTGSCVGKVRKDKTDVVFVKVEE